MTGSNFTPWWEHVNDFDTHEEREEFLAAIRRTSGVAWLKPNYTRQAKMLGWVAGYQSRKFAQPESHTGKKQS